MAASPTISISWTYDVTPKNLVHDLHTVGEKSKKVYLKAYFAGLCKAGVESAVKAARPAKYRGGLEASLKHDSKSNEDGLTIGSSLSYAPFVDGSEVSKKWPNVTSLREWVAVKVKPAASVNKKNTLSWTAYILGKYISVHGTNPKYHTHFMKAAEDRVKHEIPAATHKLAEEIIKDLKR